MVSSDMNILQIGYPKSGNYWLYKIIQETLKTAGVQQKNFIQQHPIYPIACGWDLSYPEQVDINMMDILYPACFFRISSIFRKRIENLETYVNSSTHIWSHSNFCPTSNRVFPLADRIIYIIRDPRDVALSKADFAFTPYMQKHYPTWHHSPTHFLDAEAENIAREWKNHVKAYLDNAERHSVLILFYEHMKQNFEQEFTLLLDYLGFSFSAMERNQIARKISSGAMRKESPHHVRKARHYKWMENMPPNITRLITTETKDVLLELGYPVNHTDVNLPGWEPRNDMARVTAR